MQTCLFYVWICWVFSDPPRVKGLDPHSDLPPFSLLPLFFTPVVTFACFPCPSISCSNPVFCPYPPLLFPSVSIPPPSCLHLLSQGPCGTLRGWWGWGWWWCRWWNSHSVSFVPSPTAGSPLPLVSVTLLFLSYFGNKMRWGWGGRQRGRLPVFACFIHASRCKHTPPSRHISHPCLCWSSLTTNSNP